MKFVNITVLLGLRWAVVIVYGTFERPYCAGGGMVYSLPLLKQDFSLLPATILFCKDLTSCKCLANCARDS